MHLTNDFDEYLDLLMNSIILAKHNILHPHVITPLDLLKELRHIRLSEGRQVPIPLSFSNIYKYFQICQLNVIYINKIVVFAIKIPIIEELRYNLYKLLSLPMSHTSSHYHSFIEPNSPYLLLSSTATQYIQLQQLNKCTSVWTTEYICYHLPIKRTLDQPSCETLLLRSPSRIPKLCKTRTVQAEMEIWHPLQNNRWIFITTEPIRLTTSCPNSTIEDIIIDNVGILTLRNGCKSYTPSTILEATQSNSLTYISPFPDLNIVEDDCCIIKSKNTSIEAIQLSPIKITNIKLDDLKWTNHKLHELDQILDKQLKQEVPQVSSPWYWTFLSIIGSTIGLLLVYKLFKWIGLFRCIMRILCYQTSCRSSDNCCAKIFNTNISGVAVTQAQLSRILENEASLEDADPNSISLPIVVPPRSRRSVSKGPSVDMN